MKLVVAAIQMACEPLAVERNVEHADRLLRQAHDAGAQLAVLPELFNTGYGLQPDYTPLAETADGPTIRHLRARSREWNMLIAGGFVERDGRHLHDSLALALPSGQVDIYRKQNLVFWERFRFFPGRAPVVVKTPFGRIGLAICADMIYRKVWDAYRSRIDLAIIASAWPDFACRLTGRPHWLLGHVGPLSSEIPKRVAQDLQVPVVFANQCGETRTAIPLLHARIADRFAGQSSIHDGLHGTPARAGAKEEAVIVAPVTLHSPRGPHACRSTSLSAHVASSSTLARS